MLTFKETDLIVAAEIDQSYRIRKEIYFTEEKNELKTEHDEMTNKYKCGFCNKWIKRKDAFNLHQRGCTAKILTERFETNYFKQYQVIQPDRRLELMMPYNLERGLRMYISGPPRSGKSHLIGQLIREYIRHHPDRNIFMFSQVNSDRAIDEVIEDASRSLRWDRRLFTRIDLKTIMETEINVDDFRGEYGSLCVFDDIDKITDKVLQKRVDGIKDAILATGRDHDYNGTDIDLIVSNHSSLEHHRTKELLNQATYVVIFPKGTSDHHLRTVCMKYCGLNKAQVDKIVNTDSRYVIIHREMPLFVLEEKKVWLVK